MSPEYMREWRLKWNLTQRSAANAIGCSYRSMVSYEDGNRKIPPYIARNILLLDFKWSVITSKRKGR